MLKFAHNLWVLSCHSFWRVVFTRIVLFIIDMLGKCVIVKASHHFSICMFPPHLCHVLYFSSIGGWGNLRNAPEYVPYMSVLCIIFIILWRKTWVLELVALEDNKTASSIDPREDPLNYTHKGTRGCAFLQYAAFLMQHILHSFARLLL